MTHDSHRPVYKLLLACSRCSHQAESRGSNQAVLTVNRVQQQQPPGNDICRGGETVAGADPPSAVCLAAVSLIRRSN